MFHNRRSGAESESIPGPSQVAGVAGVATATIPRSDPRRRLLDAMIETVALRGYDRTTVSRVLIRPNATVFTVTL